MSLLPKQKTEETLVETWEIMIRCQKQKIHSEAGSFPGTVKRCCMMSTPGDIQNSIGHGPEQVDTSCPRFEEAAEYGDLWKSLPA